MGIVFIILCAILAGSVVQALRSRARVKAMMAEAPAPVVTSAIAGPRAARFFEETRLLRSSVEERLAPKSEDAADFIHGDFGATDAVADHARRVSEWVVMYSEVLDENDRDELRKRGVEPELIQRMAHGANARDPRGLSLFLTDVQRVERAMLDAQPRSAYR